MGEIEVMNKIKSHLEKLGQLIHEIDALQNIVEPLFGYGDIPKAIVERVNEAKVGHRYSLFFNSINNYMVVLLYKAFLDTNKGSISLLRVINQIGDTSNKTAWARSEVRLELRNRYVGSMTKYDWCDAEFAEKQFDEASKRIFDTRHILNENNNLGNTVVAGIKELRHKEIAHSAFNEAEPAEPHDMTENRTSWSDMMRFKEDAKHLYNDIQLIVNLVTIAGGLNEHEGELMWQSMLSLPNSGVVG